MFEMLDLGATQSLLLIFGPLGMSELLFILLILVVIFGASKLPQLGRGLGEGIRNFKRGVRDESPEPPVDRVDDGGGSSGGDSRS